MPRDPRLERFIELFNRGEYWESHEALEPLWLETAPPRREFYRGLIQAAAAMVHWQRHNNHGMRVLGGKAKSKLLPFRDDAEGIDLRAFLYDWEHCLFRGGSAPQIRAKIGGQYT